MYTCNICVSVIKGFVGRGHQNIYFHFLNVCVFLFALVSFRERHHLGGPVSSGFSTFTGKTCMIIASEQNFQDSSFSTIS